MAIRYNQQLNTSINSIVRNYNAKIRRLERAAEEFILPSTDNLLILNLPANLNKLEINNKPYLKEVNLQGMDNLRDLTINGSNKYGAADFGIDVIYDFINS